MRYRSIAPATRSFPCVVKRVISLETGCVCVWGGGGSFSTVESLHHLRTVLGGRNRGGLFTEVNSGSFKKVSSIERWS
jgi:hypothetical protein